MKDIEIKIIREFSAIENTSAHLSNEIQTFIGYVSDKIPTEELSVLIAARDTFTNIHYQHSYSKMLDKIKSNEIL